MIFPLLSSVIVFCIWLKIMTNRTNKKVREANSEFWEKERLANNVRKKSLDDLEYITIPVSELPFGAITDNNDVAYIEKRIKDLSETKIVNLTGLSNTDLKLEYGTANITVLIRYDTNYTSLVTSLQRWAKFLSEKGLYAEAAKVLEFAISTKTDVTESYKLLYKIYSEHLDMELSDLDSKLDYLIQTASSLNSLSKDKILSFLNSKKSDLITIA